LLVTEVEPGSPIAAAGIVADDILHSCNAVPLLDSGQLLESWDGRGEAEPLVLGVIRKGRLYVAKLTSPAAGKERPASAPAAVGSPDTRPSATARSVAIRCGDGQIAIASTDDATFDVRVTTPDGGENHFAGPREEIIGQMRGLPERLRSYIERALRDDDPRSADEKELPVRRPSRSREKTRP
jgi:hypothetical protein